MAILLIPGILAGISSASVFWATLGSFLLTVVSSGAFIVGCLITGPVLFGVSAIGFVLGGMTSFFPGILLGLGSFFSAILFGLGILLGLGSACGFCLALGTITASTIVGGFVLIAISTTAGIPLMIISSLGALATGSFLLASTFVVGTVLGGLGIGSVSAMVAMGAVVVTIFGGPVLAGAVFGSGIMLGGLLVAWTVVSLGIVLGTVWWWRELLLTFGKLVKTKIWNFIHPLWVKIHNWFPWLPWKPQPELSFKLKAIVNSFPDEESEAVVISEVPSTNEPSSPNPEVSEKCWATPPQTVGHTTDDTEFEFPTETAKQEPAIPAEPSRQATATVTVTAASPLSTKDSTLTPSKAASLTSPSDIVSPGTESETLSLKSPEYEDGQNGTENGHYHRDRSSSSVKSQGSEGHKGTKHPDTPVPPEKKQRNTRRGSNKKGGGKPQQQHQQHKQAHKGQNN